MAFLAVPAAIQVVVEAREKRMGGRLCQGKRPGKRLDRLGPICTLRLRVAGACHAQIEAPEKGQSRPPDRDDHRRGDGRHAARARPRHGLRAAGRAQRPPVRRLPARRRPAAHRPHPPRAGRGLYGARRGARDRQAAGLCGGARPGPAQFRRRAAHRLRHERAGAGADRANPGRPPSAAASAICTRSATRPASSPGWSITPPASTGRRRRRAKVAKAIRVDAPGPARPGRARMRHRRLGQARPGGADRAARAAARRRASTRTRCARPPSCWAKPSAC